MVRKITPTAGGWSKRSALPNQHRKFEQSASRTLLALPTNAPDWRDTTIQKLFEPLVRRPLSPIILAAFRRVIAELVDLEMPQLPVPTAGPRTTIEAVSFRARLRCLLTFRNHADLLLRDWSRTISHILRQVAAAVPENRSNAIASNLTVPLIDLAPAPVDLVADIVSRMLRFAQDDPLAVVPGAVIAHRVKEALLSNSKITEEIARKNPNRIISPKQSGLTGEGLVAAFLGGTPLADLLYLPVPFVIPRKTWASHGIILAPPNHGKTQLLGNLISGFLNTASNEAVGLFILDPHGDLFNVAKDRVDPNRLVVLDPDTNPPALNFLDFGTSTEAQTLQTFSYLMSALAGGLSPKQQNIVPYLLKLLRKLQNPSIETLAYIVGEKAKSVEKSDYRGAIRSLSTTDQLFFDTVWFSDMAETKQALNWRLLGALSSDTFRQMFGAKHNSFDPDAAMRDRKVVLVKGGRNSLGDYGMEVFLQFIITQYFAAGLRRESIKDPNQRHLCVMFVDEAHTVLKSKTINDILVELRKYGCGFVAATQVLHQIADDVKAAVYGATAIKIAGPVSHDDAVQLAKNMYCDFDFIRSMKARERESADFAFHVSGITDRAMKVTVPYGTLEAMPKRKDPPVQIAPARMPQAVRQMHEERRMGTAPSAATTDTAPPRFEIKPGKEWR